MSDLPAITGLGLHTVLGSSVDATWRAMTDGRCVTTHASIDVPRTHGSRVATLAVDVAEQAMRQAGWDGSTTADPRTGLVVGTSKGEIEEWLSPPPVRFTQLQLNPAGRSEIVNTGGLGGLACRVATMTGFGDGPRLTVSAACATGLHALIRACLMLRLGEADRVLVVAAEASVHPMFVQSFNRLGVLASAENGCRPFDRSRSGFVMTEGAAAVCLERDPRQRAIVRVERYAIAGDASHLTGGDPGGRTIRRTLADVIDGRPVDYVHAHGTGTVANDPTELAAIDATVAPFDRRVPTFSHKAQLGHTQGAAGLIAVVLSAVAHQRGTAQGNVRTSNPLDARHAQLNASPVAAGICRSIQLASGFGGSTGVTSLISG